MKGGFHNRGRNEGRAKKGWAEPTSEVTGKTIFGKSDEGGLN